MSHEIDVVFIFNRFMIIDFIFDTLYLFFQDIEDLSPKSYGSGSLTQHKMATLGTHEAVRQARHRHLTNKQREQSNSDEFFK